MTDNDRGNKPKDDDKTDLSALGQSITDQDKLNYIEDLALELKQMSTKAGFETLSCIFDIAHREAKLQKAG